MGVHKGFWLINRKNELPLLFFIESGENLQQSEDGIPLNALSFPLNITIVAIIDAQCGSRAKQSFIIGFANYNVHFDRGVCASRF